MTIPDNTKVHVLTEPRFPLNGVVLGSQQLWRLNDNEKWHENIPGGWHTTPPEFVRVTVYSVRSESADGGVCEDLYEADELEIIEDTAQEA